MCVEAVEGSLPATAGGRRWHGQVKGFGDIELFSDPDGRVGTLIRKRYLEDSSQSTKHALLGELAPAELDSAKPDERLVLRLAPKRLSAHGGGMRFAAADQHA